MRVLILSHTANYWTALYARALVGMGHTVRVLSFSPEPIADIDTCFIGIEPWQKNKHAYLTRVPLVRKHLREFQPQVISASYISSNGLTASLSWNGPIVLSAHGGDLLEQASRSFLRRRVRSATVSYVCRRAAFVHTVSHEMDAMLLGMGVAPERIVRIPVGVDLEVFKPAAGLPRPTPHSLICTRKHEPIYDNATIIDALALLAAEGRDFRCTFAGRGYQMDEHRLHAERAGLADRVCFLGDQPAEAIPSLLAASDIYISASLSDGTSSALLEAMGTGLVPVVSRIAANTAWLEHGRTGLLFEPRNPGELAACLARALDDAELRQQAYHMNPPRVRDEGDLHRNMNRFAELLQRAASAGPP